ncbi:hypothetical protein HAX54_040302 [Datura stramonium]|uniref:Uncharacterized protein n=1 Tax=Datura stramonium TaxID=4076 RepID=A0ABS8VS92_DATST|nr:hypothetical protein [Datura stramonium]
MVSLVVCSSKETKTRRCCRTLVVSGWCATVRESEESWEAAIVFGCCWSRYGEDRGFWFPVLGGGAVAGGFGAARVRGKRRCAGGGLPALAENREGKGKRGERPKTVVRGEGSQREEDRVAIMEDLVVLRRLGGRVRGDREVWMLFSGGFW